MRESTRNTYEKIQHSFVKETEIERFAVEKMDRRPTSEYNEDLASTAFNYERENVPVVAQKSVS